MREAEASHTARAKSIKAGFSSDCKANLDLTITTTATWSSSRDAVPRTTPAPTAILGMRNGRNLKGIENA